MLTEMEAGEQGDSVLCRAMPQEVSIPDIRAWPRSSWRALGALEEGLNNNLLFETAALFADDKYALKGGLRIDQHVWGVLAADSAIFHKRPQWQATNQWWMILP